MHKNLSVGRVVIIGCVFVACAFAFQNCGYMGPSDPASFALSSEYVTFDVVSAKVFQPKCASCHSGLTPDAGVDLSSYQGAMAEVVAFDLSSSHIYQQLNTGAMPP